MNTRIILIFALIICQVISPPSPPTVPTDDELIGLDYCDSPTGYPNKKSTFDTDNDAYQTVENLFNIVASHRYTGGYLDGVTPSSSISLETIIQEHPGFYIRMRTTYQSDDDQSLVHIEQTSQVSEYGFEILATMKNVAVVKSYTTKLGKYGDSQLLIYSVDHSIDSVSLNVQPFIKAASSKIDTNSLEFQRIIDVDWSNSTVYLLFDLDNDEVTEYDDSIDTDDLVGNATLNVPGQIHKFSFLGGEASVYIQLQLIAVDNPLTIANDPITLNSNGVIGGNFELIYDAFWKKFFHITWTTVNIFQFSNLANINWTPTNPLTVQKLDDLAFAIIQKDSSTYNIQLITNDGTYHLETKIPGANSYVTDNYQNLLIKNTASSIIYDVYDGSDSDTYTFSNTSIIDDINDADLITFDFPLLYLLSLDQDGSSTLIYQIDITGSTDAVLQKQLDISDQLNYRLFNRVSTHFDLSIQCACSDIRVVSYNCFSTFKCTMTTSYETVDCTHVESAGTVTPG